MGHDSPAAALIDQHGSRVADEAIDVVAEPIHRLKSGSDQGR